MDNFIFTAMTGAKHNMLRQQMHVNNLANATTTGFRADFSAARAMPVFGNGFASRVYSLTERPGIDFKSGSIITTGNPLDAAIKGDGFFAVLDNNGNEAYTRAGNFRVSENGMLVTGNGLPVLGEGGPISIPPASKVDISANGSITIVPNGAPNTAVAVIDRLKLVNPALNDIKKNEQGLFVTLNGELALNDANVQVVSGAVESSNVNAASELVEMIALSRQYESQIKLMKKAEEMDQSSVRLMRIGG